MRAIAFAPSSEEMAAYFSSINKFKTYLERTLVLFLTLKHHYYSVSSQLPLTVVTTKPMWPDIRLKRGPCLLGDF